MIFLLSLTSKPCIVCVQCPVPYDRDENNVRCLACGVTTTLDQLEWRLELEKTDYMPDADCFRCCKLCRHKLPPGPLAAPPQGFLREDAHYVVGKRRKRRRHASLRKTATLALRTSRREREVREYLAGPEVKALDEMIKQHAAQWKHHFAKPPRRKKQDEYVDWEEYFVLPFTAVVTKAGADVQRKMVRVKKIRK